MATLDIASIDFTFLAAILLAKAIIFSMAFILGRLLTKSDAVDGQSLLLGGVCAFAATSSDDLGLGLPVFQAMFPPGSPSASLVSVLFILSALQGIVFNTLGFVLLGVGIAKIKSASDTSGAPQTSTCSVVLGVLRGLRKNLLVVGVLVGLAYNIFVALVTWGGFGQPLPWFLDMPCVLLGRAFSPLVLVLAGAATAGSSAMLGSISGISLPAALVCLQSIAMPFLARFLTTALGCSAELVEFAFTFGVLPAANSVLVIARSYELEAHMIASVAAFLALCKVVAFPLILFAAVLSSIGDDVTMLLALRTEVSLAVHIASAAGLGFIILSATWIASWRKCPLRRVLWLTGTLLLFSVTHAVGDAQSLSPAQYALLFPFVSIFRWSSHGTVLAFAIDLARKSAARRRWTKAKEMAEEAERSHHLLAVSEEALDLETEATWERAVPCLTKRLGILNHTLFALLFGVLMTLPWAVACDMPEPPCFTLWVPFEGVCGTSQRVVYVICYLLMGLGIAGCLVVWLLEARDAAPSPSTEVDFDCMDGDACLYSFGAARRSHFKMRIKMFCVISMVSWLLHAGLLISLVDNFTCVISPGFALALLILVVLVDGQGLILFLLFGLQPEFGQAAIDLTRATRDVLLRSACIRGLCCAFETLRAPLAHNKEVDGGSVDEDSVNATVEDLTEALASRVASASIDSYATAEHFMASTKVRSDSLARRASRNSAAANHYQPSVSNRPSSASMAVVLEMKSV